MIEESINFKKILVVEDEENIRELVKEHLEEEGYEVILAHDGADGLEKFSSNLDVGVILSDIKMPRMDGLTLLRKIKEISPQTVVIMMSALTDIQSAIKAMNAGAYTYVTKPFKIIELSLVVKRGLEKRKLLHENYMYQKHLEDLVKQRTEELEFAYAELNEAYNSTLEALVTALDARDTETEGHSIRVTEYTMELARLLNITDHEFLDALDKAALLHDIGKIGIPDAILRKPGKLTPQEWEIMKKHPIIGYEIIKKIKFLEKSAPIVLHHHERWDGKGYPDGLKGEEIPLGSRIFAVADTIDAMTSDRPYRKALTFEIVSEELKKFKGIQFDPQVVDAFFKKPLEGWKKMRDLINKNVGKEASSLKEIINEGLEKVGEEKK